MTTIANVQLLKAIEDFKVDKALTAAATDLITDDFVEEFISDSELFWGYLIESLDPYSEFMKLSAFAGTIRNSIERSSLLYRDAMQNLLVNYVQHPVRDPIYGEFRSGQGVQMGDMRPVLSAMGGGTEWAEVQLAGGPATGNIIGEWMSANGVAVEEKIWIYGSMARRTFNGHLQMDGLVFDDWNDEALEISPQDAWIRESHYFPGDHFGCGCIVAPYIPNFGPDLDLSIVQ